MVLNDYVLFVSDSSCYQMESLLMLQDLGECTEPRTSIIELVGPRVATNTDRKLSDSSKLLAQNEG